MRRRDSRPLPLGILNCCWSDPTNGKISRYRNLWAVAAATVFLLVPLLLLKLSQEGVPEPLVPQETVEPGSHDQSNQFASYHVDIRTAEDGAVYASGHALREFDKLLRVQKGHRVRLPWVERGPGNVAGRTRSLLVDPEDPTQHTWYAGAVGGGVWKTEDAGKSWVPLTDHLPNLGVSAMAMSVSNPGIIYVGTGEGLFEGGVRGTGIFKTEDRGQSWHRLAATAWVEGFRHVNSLIVAPDNADIVLAATGLGLYRSENGGHTWARVHRSTRQVQDLKFQPNDFNVQLATENERGILRSTDGGKTWEYATIGLLESVGRMELAFAPSTPTIVYASAEGLDGSSALYRSDDAGEQWYPVLDANPIVQVSWLAPQGDYNQALAVHPYSPDTVYLGGIELWRSAGTGEFRTVSALVGLEEENTKTFMGLVGYGGSHFGSFLLAGDRNDPPAIGIAPADYVTVEIRFGPGRQQMAHRFTVDETSGTRGNGTLGVPLPEYRFRDYVLVPFEVWDLTNNRQLMASFRDQADDGAFDLRTFAFSGPRRDQSFEHLYVHASRYDSTGPESSIGVNGGVLHRMLYRVWPHLKFNLVWDPASLPESTLRIEHRDFASPVHRRHLWAGAASVHVDHHHITILPANEASRTFKVISTNDGGVYYSEDSGTSWRHASQHYNTTQFYGVDKRPGFDQYVGGMQDNGTWRSYAGASATRGWRSVLGGDGIDAEWHAENEALMLTSLPRSRIFRSTTMGRTWTESSPESFGSHGVGQALTALANSDDDPDIVYTIGPSGIWRSDDFGLSWMLIPIANELWTGGINSSGKIRISEANPTVVWAGFRMDKSPPYTGTLHLSQDRGLTFEPVTVPDIAPESVISGLATHPHNGDTGYALFSVPGRPKILRTTDFGQSWTDLSGFAASENGGSTNGFPDVAVYDLLVMPHDPGILWAATEIGIFVSDNAGDSWEYSNFGLPAVSIWRLRLVDDQVIAATHGRGVWTVDLVHVVSAEEELIDVPAVFRLEQNYPNPFSGRTTLVLSLREASQVEFSVFDVTGRKLVTLVDRPLGAGVHCIPWDASGYASGIYFGRVEAGGLTRTQRMLLLK